MTTEALPGSLICDDCRQRTHSLLACWCRKAVCQVCWQREHQHHREPETP